VTNGLAILGGYTILAVLLLLLVVLLWRPARDDSSSD
jgi:hypothetical protein